VLAPIMQAAAIKIFVGCSRMVQFYATCGQTISRPIMQSVFRSAARRAKTDLGCNPERRDGELKTDWTKPLVDSPAYGF